MLNRSSFKTPLFLLLLLIIIIAALQLEASVPMKTFHLVDLQKSMPDARLHCKEKFTDLAYADQREGLQKKCMVIKFVWTGLYRDPGDPSVWKWTSERGDAVSVSDINWGTGYPKDNDNCACISCSTGQWRSSRCFLLRKFMCFVDNVILVKENKTWEEALEHCRAIGSVDPSRHHLYRKHQYDLVSLQSEDDHRYARDKIQEATTNEVWTALRFLAGQWLWVDGEPQRYQDLPLCPAWGRHCGTLPKNHTAQWQIRDCMERRNFLCIKSP